jgi:hypothetical protein
MHIFFLVDSIQEIPKYFYDIGRWRKIISKKYPIQDKQKDMRVSSKSQIHIIFYTFCNYF